MDGHGRPRTGAGMNPKTHFPFRIDRWDDAGNMIEQHVGGLASGLVTSPRMWPNTHSHHSGHDLDDARQQSYAEVVLGVTTLPWGQSPVSWPRAWALYSFSLKAAIPGAVGHNNPEDRNWLRVL